MRTEHKPTKTDFLSAYLELGWETKPDTTLTTWVMAFETALEKRQDSECRRLLQEIKRAAPTLEIEQISRYAEGRWAEQRGEYGLAISLYQACLQTEPGALRQAQLFLDLGRVYYEIGQLPAAVEKLMRSLKLYQSENQPSETLSVLNQLGAVYTEQGRWQEAQEYYDRALALVTSPIDKAALWANLASWHQEQGQFEAAEKYFTDALGVYQSSGDIADQALLLNNLGLLALEQRKPEKAETLLKRALELDQSIGNWSSAVQTLGNLALTAEASSGLEKGVEYATEAIASAGELEDFRALSVFLNLRGMFYIDLRQLEAAAADLERSVELARQTQNQTSLVTALNNLGTAYRHGDNLLQAYQCYEQSLALAEQLGQQKRVGEIVGNLAHLYSQQGNSRQAKVYYERSKSIARQVRDPELESTALIGLATMALEEGDFKAVATLTEQLWALGERTHQLDVLVRAGWLRGDLALVAGEIAAIFTAYAQAAEFAVQNGGDLLAATLERIAIHLDYMEKPAVAAACNQLRTAWRERELLQAQPEIEQWLQQIESVEPAS